MLVSRRQLVLSTAATGLAACATSVTPARKGLAASFLHGVASGHPKMDGFLIWTRITPEDVTATIPARWEVSDTRSFKTLIRSGKATAFPGKDWTIKVEIDELDPEKHYFYRFLTGDAASPVGRSKTLPQNQLAKARFAVVSCSNYPFGYFNVYDHIAKQDDLDAVLHLGDYIYEYGTNGYGGKVGAKLGRDHVPAAEIVSLQDYRQRHAQYKSDPASQRLLAAHPLIAIWDDHETTNNSWENGAQNHQANEGNWDVRKSAALKAYYEWMPVRDPSSDRPADSLFETYQWGDLLTLATIETRLTARTEQLEYSDIIPTLKTPEDISRFKREILGSEARHLMGDPQRDYLKAALEKSKASGTSWRFIANQVIMADVAAPDISDFADDPAIDAIEKELPQIRDFLQFTALGLPLNLDAWDGYPAARERLYDLAESSNVRDLLVLTGDTHEYWVNDLYRENGQKMGLELGVAAVTSPGASTYFGEKGDEYSDRLIASNKSVLYHDPYSKGYIDLTVRQDSIDTKFVTVNTILSQDYKSQNLIEFSIIRQGKSLGVSGDVFAK